MSLTGGLPVRREGLGASVEVVSSDQMSPRSSDISTNSRVRTRLTTFGGREAAGLYGPGLCSETGSGGCAFVVETEVSGVGSSVAAAASRARPEVDPEAGVKVGSVGRRAGSGKSPRPDPMKEGAKGAVRPGEWALRAAALVPGRRPTRRLGPRWRARLH
jgi:hypothetical protein